MISLLVIGAGPAAYEASKIGINSTVLESDRQVGGLSRTVNYKGYRFDIGGHRFFSKVRLINELWEEILSEDFLLRPRLSRIYPAPPDKILRAAHHLRYRDYLTAVLIVNREAVFPDNWIYIHSPDVKMGRIQNYKNWSPEMVPDPGRTSLGLEYFLWGLLHYLEGDQVEMARAPCRPQS